MTKLHRNGLLVLGTLGLLLGGLASANNPPRSQGQIFRDCMDEARRLPDGGLPVPPPVPKLADGGPIPRSVPPICQHLDGGVVPPGLARFCAHGL